MFEIKAYSFKCKIGGESKLKSVSESQSIHFKFEEYKQSVDGEDYQKECDKYFIKSPNH